MVLWNAVLCSLNSMREVGADWCCLIVELLNCLTVSSEEMGVREMVFSSTLEGPLLGDIWVFWFYGSMVLWSQTNKFPSSCEWLSLALRKVPF